MLYLQDEFIVIGERQFDFEDAVRDVYAPTIAEITVIRRGDVRRAKLYYLRGRRGKSARIVERQDHTAQPGKAEAKAAE